MVDPRDRVMAALARRVPLTLLADLADPAGPDSRGILAAESADQPWLDDLAFPRNRQRPAALRAAGAIGAVSAPATG